MKKINKDKPGNEKRYHLIGWSLFVTGVLFFIASRWIGQNTLKLVGTFIFSLACASFLTPMLWPDKNTDHESIDDL